MNSKMFIPHNQKIVSLESLRNRGYSQYRINKLVAEGNLTKLNKKMYENNKYRGNDMDFYFAYAYVPKGVICLQSAAEYYNLSDYIPDAIEVAVPRKANISTLPEWPTINLHYFTDERFLNGIKTIKIDNNQFRIYDLEKTVIDIVFYREKIGIEEMKEVLTNYLKRENRNLDKLLKYADILKCGKTIRQYLEVLV